MQPVIVKRTLVIDTPTTKCWSLELSEEAKKALSTGVSELPGPLTYGPHPKASLWSTIRKWWSKK